MNSPNSPVPAKGATAETLGAEAAEKTIQQFLADSLTPDRNYKVPTEHILHAITTALASAQEGTGLINEKGIVSFIAECERTASTPEAKQIDDLREEVADLKRKELVLYDIHHALGIKWGDDPYYVISRLRQGLETLRTREPSREESGVRLLNKIKDVLEPLAMSGAETHDHYKLMAKRLVEEHIDPFLASSPESRDTSPSKPKVRPYNAELAAVMCAEGDFEGLAHEVSRPSLPSPVSTPTTEAIETPAAEAPTAMGVASEESGEFVDKVAIELAWCRHVALTVHETARRVMKLVSSSDAHPSEAEETKTVAGIIIPEEAPHSRVQELQESLSRLQRELEEARKDTKRLDWLDEVNAKLNAETGSSYGWQFSINHNRAALMDHHFPALSVRQAIDAALAAPQKAS